MDFARTNATLGSLKAFAADRITLQEAAALLRAVVEDVTQEAAPLKSLSVTEQAATDWMAVSRALLDADVSAELDEMSEKKQERLKALTRSYREKYEANQAAIEQAQMRLSAAEAENEELRRKLELLEQEKQTAQSMDKANEALRREISALENEIAELEKSAELLKDLHEKTQKALADRRIEKQSWEQILDDARVKLAQAEEELKSKQKEQTRQELSLSEKKTAAEDLQRIIDDMTRQTEEAEQRINRLLEEKEQLSAVDTEGMRRRAAELEQHNERLQQENNELRVQISSLKLNEERIKNDRQDFLEQIKRLKEEAENAEVELRSKKAEITEQQNLIARLKGEKKAFEQALSPEEAARRKDEIASLQRALKMYERIVRELFSGEGDYDMESIKDKVEAFNSALNAQLSNLRQLMNTLKNDYLDVISQIEREVNRDEM